MLGFNEKAPCTIRKESIVMMECRLITHRVSRLRGYIMVLTTQGRPLYFLERKRVSQ